MKIKVTSKKNYNLLEIEGAINAGNEYDLAEKVEKFFKKGEAPRVIIDLKKVPYINSATLSVFLSIHKRVEKMNGHFSLCGINREVEKLMELTKLTSIIEIHKNIEEALEAYEE